MTHAADPGNVGRSQPLTQRDVGINKRDSGGRTAAHRAAMRGDKETLLALLDAGCEIDAADSCYMTPLMYAAGEGHTECVRLLAQRGANVNERGLAATTAAHHATCRGRKEALQALLDGGCEIDATDWCGKTTLMCAACEGHVECLQLLIQRGADVHKRDDDGFTAAHFAAQYGKVAALQTLLAFDADVLSLPGFSVADRAAEHFQVDALLYAVACGCPFGGPAPFGCRSNYLPFLLCAAVSLRCFGSMWLMVVLGFAMGPRCPHRMYFRGANSFFFLDKFSQFCTFS